MKIDRQQFLEHLSAIITIPGLTGLDFNKASDVQNGWEYLSSTPVTFLVDIANQIKSSDWDTDAVVTRSMVYGIFPDLIKNLDDLEFEIERYQPLCWLFDQRYYEFQENIEDVDDDYDDEDEPDFDPASEHPVILVRPGEETWPADFDGDPKILKRWSTAIGEDKFLVQAQGWIDEWLEEEPTGEDEDLYFDDPGSPEDEACKYFTADTELAGLLNIVIVEGDRPGSSWRGAVLETSLEKANQVCKEHGIPIKFVSEG